VPPGVSELRHGQQVGRTQNGDTPPDNELHLVAAFRRAARERGGPLPSIEVADALLDERCERAE